MYLQSPMNNKIVISPSNKKAIDFFDDLNKKKAQIRQKIANSPLVTKMKEKVATFKKYEYKGIIYKEQGYIIQLKNISK